MSKIVVDMYAIIIMKDQVNHVRIMYPMQSMHRLLRVTKKQQQKQIPAPVFG